MVLSSLSSRFEVRPCIPVRNPFSGVEYPEDMDSNVVYRDITDLTTETRLVLKDWLDAMKEMYKEKGIDAMKPMQKSVHDIIRWRDKLRCGRCGARELQDLRKCIIRKIDVGNSQLGHDMIVRGASGQRLSSSTCSVLELFAKHEAVTDQIFNDQKSSGESSMRRAGAFSLLLDIHSLNFSFKVRGKFELTMALYDCNLQQFFSDTLVISVPSVTSESVQLNAVSLFTDLGTKDMERPHVMLVCRVLRVGPLEGKEGTLPTMKTQRGPLFNHIGSPVQLPSQLVRQPYFIALTDITQMLKSKVGESGVNSGNHLDSDECVINANMVLKHYQDDGFMSTLQRNMPSAFGGKAEQISGTADDSNPQYLSITARLLDGSKEDCYNNYRHLFLNRRQPAVLRKMGFPEVIESEDVRNELYVTLSRAELTNSNKQNDKKNVEVRVCVCDARGIPMSEKVVICGENVQKRTEFHSLVHYHNERPNWSEVIKIALPYDVLTEQDQVEQKGIHIRFHFRHRSSNESKDRAEKPFALSFLKLIQDDQTIVCDNKYDLLVYKIGDKRSQDGDIPAYMLLYDTRLAFNKCQKDKQQHRVSSGSYTLCLKDEFYVSTVTCSTVVTQSADLLGLLGWRNIHANRERRNIKTSLQNLKDSDEEIVKFLDRVLDSLFEILTDEDQKGENDVLVFNTLVYAFELVNQKRYHNFKPVMETYLNLKFSATLAWRKLVSIMHKQICILDTVGDHASGLRMLQNMDYTIRFIVKSKQLYMAMMGWSENDESGFVGDVTSLLESLANQMNKLPLPSDCNRNSELQSCLYRAAILKHTPDLIPHLIALLGPVTVAQISASLFRSIPEYSFMASRLVALVRLVQGELMRNPTSRAIVVNVVTEQVVLILDCDKERRRKGGDRKKEKEVQGVYLDEANAAADLLRVLLERLANTATLSFGHDNEADIKEVVLSTLRIVQQTLIRLMMIHRAELTPNQNKILPKISSVYLSLLDSVTPQLFLQLTLSGTEIDVCDFMREMLQLFANMCVASPFNHDWFHMICLQNKCIREALALIKGTFDKSRFFNFELWEQYFKTLVDFITQRQLSVEDYTDSKRESLPVTRDVRQECVSDLTSSWHTLNQSNKKLFIPCMVKPFLRVCLVANQRIRETILPIFYDMLTTEFTYLQLKGQVKTALMCSLDELSEEGLGDEQFISAFEKQMMELGSSHSDVEIREGCVTLARNVQDLMKRLGELTLCDIQFHSVIFRIKATYRLFEFYKDNGLEELKIRYLFKLLALNKSADNKIEMSYTMLKLSHSFKWEAISLSPEVRSLVSGANFRADSHQNLKIVLHQNAIKAFDLGQLWELAIECCDELEVHYKQSLNFELLADILVEKATYYRKIVREPRYACNYYFVGFYGRSFPESLANSEFIYRSRPLEMRSDFESRLHAAFPSARLLKSISRPNDAVRLAEEQCILVIAVTPLTQPGSMLSAAHTNIKWFLRHNRVCKFKNDVPRRDIHIESTSLYASFANNDDVNVWKERREYKIAQPLPHLLPFNRLMTDTCVLMSPLECAVDNITESNGSLWESIEQCRPPSAERGLVSQLQMKLKGMIMPEVQKGSIVYHHTLLSPTFTALCNDEQMTLVDELKHALSVQAVLLELGLMRHKDRMVQPPQPASVELHRMMVDAYIELRPKLQFIKMKSMLTPGESIRLPVRESPLSRFPSNEPHRGSVSSLQHSESSPGRNTWMPGRSGAALTGSTNIMRTFHRKVTSAGHDIAARRTSQTSLDSNDFDSSTNSAILLTETVTSLRPPRPRNDSHSSRESPVASRSASISNGDISDSFVFDSCPTLPPRPNSRESMEITPKRPVSRKFPKPLPPLPLSPRKEESPSDLEDNNFNIT